MKKFFKALALVLALTLVIGTIPASAATTITPDKSRTLYVGGTRGFDNQGVKSTFKQKASYATLLNITKDEVKSLGIKAVSSDTSVVKCYNKKTRLRISAIGIGEATVTFTGKDKKSYTIPVTVKKSATNDTVTLGRDLKGLTSYEANVGDVITVSVPYTKDKDGKRLDTDKRRLVVYNAEGEEVTTEATVTPDETKARLWTVKFNKAGKYTVAGEAYQSKKYVGATGTAAVEVTVKGKDFEAKQTKANEITVTGSGFDKEKTTVTVKRGTVAITPKVAVNSETEIVLTFDAKLSDAEYTVTATTGDVTNSDTVKAEAEKVDRIIIQEKEKNIDVKTSSDRNTIYVHYEVQNQFQENISKTYGLTWSSSFGNDTQKDSRTEGVVSFTSSDEARYGESVYVTATYTGSGYAVPEVATLKVGGELSAGTAEFVGIWDFETKKKLDKLPAMFVADRYGIIFRMKDQDDGSLLYKDTYAKGLSFSSKNPEAFGVKSQCENDPVTIGDTEYAVVKINNVGYMAKSCTQGTVLAIGTKNGKQSEMTVEFEASQILKSFRFLAPEGIIKSDSGKQEIKFEAIDEQDKPITKFRDLVKAVNLVGDAIEIVENDDGTAKALLNTAGLNKSTTVDYPYVIMATIPSQKENNTSSLNIQVKPAAYNAAVKGIANEKNLYMVRGGSTKVDLDTNDYADSYDGERLTFVNQYDETCKYIAGDVYARIKNSNAKVILSGGAVTTSSDGELYDADYTTVKVPAAGLTIECKNGYNEEKGTQVIEYFIGDTAKKKIVPGSNKSLTYTIVEVTDFTGFELESKKLAANTIIYGAQGSYKVYEKSGKNVSGVLANGIKVPLTDNYVKNFGVNIHPSLAALVVASGNSIKLQGDKITVTGSGVYTNFDGVLKDMSATKADGTYAYMFSDVSVSAKIYNVTSQGAIDALVSNVSTKVSVGGEWGILQPLSKSAEVANAVDGVIELMSNKKDDDGNDVSPIEREIARSYNGFNEYLGELIGNDIYDQYDKIGALTPSLLNVEISNYQENPDGFHNELNGKAHVIQNNGSNTTKILNAEIGDKFTATFTYTNAADGAGTASVTINVVVGHDKNANITPKQSEPEWY